MQFKSHRISILLAVLTISGLGLAAYAYSNPGVVTCVVSGSQQTPSALQAQLLSDSRARIQSSFGSLRSKPMVVFFNESNAFWPLKPNEYGSTSFIGSKVCVIVGPKGQNIDVLAHELMHAEIADRVGYWRRWTQLPIWFDEGLAMQVDYRPDYNLSESDSSDADDVKSLRSASEFFAPTDALLTKNYASAKVVVKKWVADVGSSKVYRQLERVRAGESFESMISKK
jgi:hypothetical protein